MKNTYRCIFFRCETVKIKQSSECKTIFELKQNSKARKMFLEYLQNPRKHRENMKTQKSSRLVSNPGLWGDSANHLTTVPPPPLNPICQCIYTSEFVCFYTFTSEFMKWWRSPHSEWWMCEAVNNCREGKRTSPFFFNHLVFLLRAAAGCVGRLFDWGSELRLF